MDTWNPAGPIFGRFRAQRRSSLVGARAIPDDIKGLGWVFVRELSLSPLDLLPTLYFSRFARIFILVSVPVSSLGDLGDWPHVLPFTSADALVCCPRNR